MLLVCRVFNHDDPTLVLADLVIKNRVKKNTKRTDDDDDDDWGVFDEDVGTSDDPEAMRVFEQEQARRHRVQDLKREREEKVGEHPLLQHWNGRNWLGFRLRRGRVSGYDFVMGTDEAVYAVRTGLCEGAQARGAHGRDGECDLCQERRHETR